MNRFYRWVSRFLILIVLLQNGALAASSDGLAEIPAEESPATEFLDEMSSADGEAYRLLREIYQELRRKWADAPKSFDEALHHFAAHLDEQTAEKKLEFLRAMTSLVWPGAESLKIGPAAQQLHLEWFQNSEIEKVLAQVKAVNDGLKSLDALGSYAKDQPFHPSFFGCLLAAVIVAMVEVSLLCCHVDPTHPFRERGLMEPIHYPLSAPVPTRTVDIRPRAQAPQFAVSAYLFGLLFVISLMYRVSCILDRRAEVAFKKRLGESQNSIQREIESLGQQMGIQHLWEIFSQLVDLRRVLAPCYQEFEDCPVCMESYSDPHKAVSTTCFHKFHRECLEGWWETLGMRECPLCRTRGDMDVQSIWNWEPLPPS